MALLFIHFILTLQSDIISSECNVDNCDPNHCEGVGCSQCLPGYYDLYKDNRFCGKCYLGCQPCNGDQCYSCKPSTCNGTDICDYANCNTKGCSGPYVASCSGCPDGFYFDSGYCFRCDNINCKCSSASSCDKCLPGYYATNTFCTKCVPGKYGHSCEQSCISSCGNGTCDKESGTCLIQCAAEEYLDDTGQCQPCQSYRCASCANSTYCSSCQQSFYWGHICEFDCVGCIGSCNRNDGCSAGCDDPNYYNTYSPEKEGYDCIRCFNQCRTCLNDTYCTSCKDNFWGRKCLYSCNNCNGTCDKDYGCIDCCELGYYREQIDEGHECKPCSEHCEQCLDTLTCQVCEDGYYVDENNKICISCSTNCTDNICDSSNGTCTRGCPTGSTGHRCNQQCPIHCVECGQFTSSNCLSCKSGFHGDRCEYSCDQNCKTTNGVRVCLKEDGTCARGCKNEFWGKTCINPCSYGCFYRVCYQTNGECLIGCNAGYHGANCSLKCPDSCLDDRCFQDNGTCVVKPISESTTGRHVEDSDGTPQSLADLDSTNSANIGLAVVVGIVCIVAVASIIVNVFLWRSRQASQPATQRSNDRQLTDISPARQSENVGYEDLTSVRPEEKMYSSITHEYENTNMSA